MWIKKRDNGLILDFFERENFGVKIAVDVLGLWYMTKMR